MKSKNITLSFHLLNFIQFFAAINENLYKLLAGYFLISIYGEGKTNIIMAMIGALFILPFLLFSSFGGVFADKVHKNRIFITTRIFELTCLLLSLVFFGLKLAFGAYVVLFLMASLSAIFGPAKYGMIPELVDPSKLLYANSIIAAFTFLGIIIGTALASFMVWVSSSNYTLALLASIVFASLGSILSFFLPKTPKQNAHKSFRIFIYMELFEALKQMHKIPSLSGAVFAYSYFLFVGGFVQLNIIPYTINILKLNDIIGGYFFLVTALGLGLGAYFTNVISKGEIVLKIVPLSGIGISIILCLMKWLFTPWWLIIIWMALLGFLGGMFIVAPQAFILYASPSEDRGRNFATANFMSFVFALLSAVAIYILNTAMHLSPASSFFVVGVINFLVIATLIKATGWLSAK